MVVLDEERGGGESAEKTNLNVSTVFSKSCSRSGFCGFRRTRCRFVERLPIADEAVGVAVGQVHVVELDLVELDVIYAPMAIADESRVPRMRPGNRQRARN